MKCQRMSHDGIRSYECLRPVKEEGLCAQHLAGKRRADRNDLARAAMYESRAAHRAVMCRLADRLSGVLGVHCSYDDHNILISQYEAEDVLKYKANQ